MPRWLRGISPKWMVSGSPRRAALGDLHRVDVADQVGDARCPGWPASRRTARRGAATRPAGRRRARRARRRDCVGDRLVGVLAELGAGDHRRPLVEQARPACAAAGSCPGRARRAARRRGRRSAPARAAGSRCPRSRAGPATGRRPSRERGEQVVADLARAAASGRGRTRGARRGCHGGRAVGAEVTPPRYPAPQQLDGVSGSGRVSTVPLAGADQGPGAMVRAC